MTEDRISVPGRSEAAPEHLKRATLEDKVRFLSDPASYPHQPDSVDARETHMSWVFLVGSLVYKLKKPVRRPHLDFRTLSAREHFTREEVRLNRRLAPQVYLDVTALACSVRGRLSLGGDGEVIDWLVTMRRLPDDRMLDRLIIDGKATRPMVEQLAAVLAAFFAEAEPVRPPIDDQIERYRREQDSNAAVLLDPLFRFDGRRVEAVLSRCTDLLDAIRPHLEARIDRGRIVEGHGDLRPEHVCFTDPIAVIDRLEFDRDFRLLDPFEEIAFLGLECAQLGAEWVYPLLFDHCATALNDAPPKPLLDFYWTYRALLRARLSLAHLAEPEPRTPEKWRPLTWRYIELAERPPAIPQG